MFNNSKFINFLENYKDRLFGVDDLIVEARNDYRAKKLLMFYALKDNETFYYYLKFDEFKKLLPTLKYVLETIQYHPKYGTNSIKELSQILFSKYLSDLEIDGDVDFDLVDGAYKFITDFTGREKLEELTSKYVEVKFNINSLQFV